MKLGDETCRVNDNFRLILIVPEELDTVPDFLAGLIEVHFFQSSDEIIE